MKVERFSSEPLKSNCYLVHDQKEGLIIDPGGISQELLDFLQTQKVQVKAIINTHGHGDHIAGNSWIMEHTGAPLWIHEEEAEYLSDPALNLGTLLGLEFPPVKAERFLAHGDLIFVGKKQLKVLHTPGHTPGGICLFSPGFLISGDTLFKSSAGRWDLPRGNRDLLQQSLLRLARLPLDTIVYPGHGESTTIRDEIENNPFL